MAAVTGLMSANHRSGVGNVDGSTKVDDTKMTGNIHTNPAELTVSTELTDSPIRAMIQLKA